MLFIQSPAVCVPVNILERQARNYINQPPIKITIKTFDFCWILTSHFHKVVCKIDPYTILEKLDSNGENASGTLDTSITLKKTKGKREKY